MEKNPRLSADVSATIVHHTVIATVPFGTQVAGLIATFSTTASEVTVGDIAQMSGVTLNDFTIPVIYHLVAEDRSTTDYTVVVRGVTQHAYVKASNTDMNDAFGDAVALSADGSTLAVGAPGESSGATGIDGDQADNSARRSGAVYVFTRSGPTWIQQAYIKASNPGVNEFFGASIALSGDGSTLAVGAVLEDSGATGVDGDQADNTAENSGAAYVFARTGTTWSQQAYVKASNTGAYDGFGASIALSGDGSTLAVGATGESSGATGIDGDQADNTAGASGAVYVFTRSGATWSQQAYVKASNTGYNDWFGHSVALTGDGSILAVGAMLENSRATGIDGDQLDNRAPSAGAVYVFTRSGATWSQQAYVKASNTGYDDFFGASVALTGDGSILAVGAYGEFSGATGIGGDQGDNSAPFSGAVYVFARSGMTWSQEAYIKASNTGYNDGFGQSIALSGDGSTLAVGATFEDSAATGVDGKEAGNSAPESGAVYVFRRAGTKWSQNYYLKASNTGSYDSFSRAVALSSDGTTLAVGASEEDSGATGIGGDQDDNTAQSSGAVYVFR